MSFDHDRPSKWFNPGDVAHYSMMKRWLDDANSPTRHRPSSDEPLHAGKLDRSAKLILAGVFFLLFVCAIGHVAYGFLPSH
jgi:hypothetical protein